MPSILVVGYNAWDTIVPLPSVPPPDSKYEVDGIVSCGGGPAANAAAALAALGAEVRLATVLADDDAGRRQRDDLRARGVDLGLCRAAPGARTPAAVILAAPDGGRRILWSRGDLPRLDPAAVGEDWLDGIDLLLFDGHEPAAAGRLADVALARGLPAVMDAGGPRPEVVALGGRCTDLIASAAFGASVGGSRDPFAALRALRRGPVRRAAITCGEAGCLAVSDGAPFHVPAFAVAALDTTGAGDVFHAGYAFARADGAGFREALDFASAAAALKCLGRGGRLPAPDLPAVRAILADGPRSDRKPGRLPAADG